jgi:acyl dehydratase
MAIDTACVGRTTKTHSLEVDWRTLATYALGIGAKKDELAFLYEGTPGGMKTYPTFAVVPTYAPLVESLAATGGDMAMVVHGAQSIRVVNDLPGVSNGDKLRLETTGKISALYDLKKFAQVIIDTETKLDGTAVFETKWSIIYRGAGGFAGPRPPESDAPSLPKDRAPDFSSAEKTTPEQALLYRISGDQNPLHADPVFAERVGFPQGPILHGLCTFGFLGRAVVKHVCGGDPSRLRFLSAQFRKPVWPGDTLETRGFHLDGDRVALGMSVVERNEAVLSGAHAQVTR